MLRAAAPIAPVILAIGATAALAAAAESARVDASATENASGATINLAAKGPADLPLANAQVAGGVLVVRFDAPVEANISALQSGAPRTIAAARTDGDGKGLRISLRRTLKAALQQTPRGATILLSPVDQGESACVQAALETSSRDTTATLSIGTRPDVTRLSFQFSGPAGVAQKRTGDRLELRFNRAAVLDLSQLLASAPAPIRSVERLPDAAGKPALALILQTGARVRQFNEGGRVIVDLIPPAVDPANPGQPLPEVAPGADPMPKSGVAPVEVEEKDGETRIRIAWAGPARAAAFKRGETAWLLFDSKAKLELRGRNPRFESFKGEGVTGLRVRAPDAAFISAKAEGNAWIFTLGPREPRGEFAAIRRDVGVGGHGRLVAAFGREGVVRRVVDPAVGDNLDVALMAGPPKAVQARRATREAALLATAQGAVVEYRAEGVGAQMSGGELIVTSSSRAEAPASLEAISALETKSLLDVSREAAVPDETVYERIADLNRRAAAEGFDIGSRATARLALAKFLVAHELGAEALGALKTALVNQPHLENDPSLRLMRAAANVMMGRLKDAKFDLESAALTDDPSASLWRGWIAAQEQNWVEARKQIVRGQRAIDAQPESWRARFRLAWGQSLLALGALNPAAEQAAKVANADDQETSGLGKILLAKVAEARGDVGAAKGAMSALEASPSEVVAVRALYEGARLKRATGADAKAMIDELEALRMRWRGDGLELEIIQQLAGFYREQGRWREALMLLRSASTRYASLPATRGLLNDMGDLFERLYLDGEADGMQPVQALGLFYDFKELTPIGPNGDRMVRNLAARLVKLDLMEQAAALLQHQVDERLQGVAKAQIASDLALVYLSDRKPDKALAAIEISRQPNIPASLVAERRILESRAYLDLGRIDQALEVLERDKSPDAQALRADIAWRDRNWPKAAAEIRFWLNALPRNESLDETARSAVLKAAIAYTFAEDKAGLATLRRDFAAKMAGTADADAFDVVAEGIDGGSGDVQEVAKRVARTELFERFLSEQRKNMSQQAAKPAPPRA
jgi:tetratricopeptide (TPR) repeat protein